MTNQIAETFMQALHQTEQTRDAESLIAVFAENAEISNLTLPEPLRGRDGVRQFWQAYLHQFDHIHSEFTAISEAEGTAVLEWEAEGALRDGKPITYRGVTILETEGEHVKQFRAYYDSAAFLQPHAQSA